MARSTFTERLKAKLEDIVTPLKAYCCHPAFSASFALSLLYLSLLSFGSQMVAYLLMVGFSASEISVVRAVAVGFELTATWIAPKAMNAIGPIRAGLWFINYQALSVGIAVAAFINAATDKLGAAGLVGGVILSRIGLWGFDLSAQVII